MSNNSLENLNKEDTYSMMLMLLYASSDNPRYSTLNELAYILDHENFLRFIKYYAGQTIEIPTMSAVTDSLRLLMLFQYYKIEKLPWKEAITKAGYEESDSVSVRHKLNKFMTQLETFNYKLGGILS